MPRFSIVPLLCLGLALCAAAAAPSSPAAGASTLRDIKVETLPTFIEVALVCDNPPSYTTEFRYNPDRYVVTLTNCTLTLPAGQAQTLAKLGGTLLTRVSAAQAGTASAPVVQLGFYLNQRTEPFIRPIGGGYALRFCTSGRCETTSQLAPGISVVQRDQQVAGSNLSVYLVRLAPDASASVYAAAADRYDGKSHVRKPTSFAAKENADVVINGGFFGKGGQHLTTFVEDGFVRATGVYPNRPMLVVGKNGQVAIGRYTPETALLVDDGKGGAKRIPLYGKNYPYERGRVIAYDNSYPRETLPKDGMFFYLLSGDRLKYAGEDPAAPALPQGTVLIATDIMPEANPLQGIAPTANVRLETKLTDANGQAVLARYAIGGGPMLVENGAVNISTAEDSIKTDISTGARSRTACALTKNGQLLLAVVKEDESTAHSGFTLEQLAQLLVSEGAVTALNFDGGGSSAMVVAGDLLNEPTSSERPVSNVLVVKAGVGGPLTTARTTPRVTAPPKQDAPPADPGDATPVTKYDRGG